MRIAGRTLAIWLSLTSSLTAYAQAAGIYGVTSGLFLNGPSAPTPAVCPAGTCCQGTNLTLSEGNYELTTGVPYALSHAVSLSNQVYNTCGAVDGGTDNCRQPPLEFGAALAANTVYYCYLNQAQILFCSTKAPYPNGQPSGVNGIEIASNVYSRTMIFVGSFMTDPNTCIIPFERLGEHVLFKPGPTISGNYVDAGLGTPTFQYAFNGGIAACAWPIQGGNDNCRTLKGAALDEVLPFYPLSASAGIFDIHVVNLNPALAGVLPGDGPNGLVIQFYEPTPYYGGGTPSVQAEVAVGGSLSSSIPEIETERVTLNLNQFPPQYSSSQYYWPVPLSSVSAGQFGADPSAVAGTGVFAILRGYIEPIQRLYSR